MEREHLGARRPPFFWALLIGATAFMSIEPGLFLVVLALGLSALALTWILMLARLLLLDALGRAPDAPECAVPTRNEGQK